MPPSPRDPTMPNRKDHCDHLELAWGLIANAYGGNWDEADETWRLAAERWRDRWHEMLHCCCTAGAEQHDVTE